jgi:hypothetical protein
MARLGKIFAFAFISLVFFDVERSFRRRCASLERLDCLRDAFDPFFAIFCHIFRNVTVRQKIGSVLAPPVPAGHLYRYSMKPHD